MFKLTAERDCCEPIELYSNERYTKEQAFTFCEGFIEAMGDERWPSGYDAVIRFSDGSAYMLADEWEELEEPCAENELPSADNLAWEQR